MGGEARGTGACAAPYAEESTANMKAMTMPTAKVDLNCMRLMSRLVALSCSSTRSSLRSFLGVAAAVLALSFFLSTDRGVRAPGRARLR